MTRPGLDPAVRQSFEIAVEHVGLIAEPIGADPFDAIDLRRTLDPGDGVRRKIVPSRPAGEPRVGAQACEQGCLFGRVRLEPPDRLRIVARLRIADTEHTGATRDERERVHGRVERRPRLAVRAQEILRRIGVTRTAGVATRVGPKGEQSIGRVRERLDRRHRERRAVPVPEIGRGPDRRLPGVILGRHDGPRLGPDVRRQDPRDFPPWVGGGPSISPQSRPSLDITRRDVSAALS